LRNFGREFGVRSCLLPSPVIKGKRQDLTPDYDPGLKPL
jgi:hypothetical protein